MVPKGKGISKDNKDPTNPRSAKVISGKEAQHAIFYSNNKNTKNMKVAAQTERKSKKLGKEGPRGDAARV